METDQGLGQTPATILQLQAIDQQSDAATADRGW